MLNSIAIVTILSDCLTKTEHAYKAYLGYHTVESGQISPALANSWGADKLAHNQYILMQPASGAEVFLRFIGVPPSVVKAGEPKYQAMRQEGWNAVELLVQDPDLLATQFTQERSPFRVIGEPRFLDDGHGLRAMQALGPNGELLYFTQVLDPVAFDLDVATSFVDKAFIVVTGSKDGTKVGDFYRRVFRQSVQEPTPFRIGVLSDYYSLPPDTLHLLSLVRLTGKYMVEIDEYPESALNLNTQAGELPYGVAMVSFRVSHLKVHEAEYFAQPIYAQGCAYQGVRTATLSGASGERIELIEERADQNQRLSNP